MSKPTPFGTYIRERRLASGKTQQDLAEAMDVTRAYVRQVEAGERGPFLRRHWPAIVATIGADPAELDRLSMTELDQLRARVAELTAKLTQQGSAPLSA